MSHPMYNHYAAGNQRPTQGQYGPSSMQTDRDPQLAPSHMGPGTNFSSVGVSSGTPASFVGVPSIPLLSQSMNYRPEQSWGPMDKDIERSIDMHISRVRESVGKPMSQTTGQGTSLSSSLHDELHHSGVGMSSYHMSSTSARNACVEKGSSSLDWLSNYSKRPTTDSFRSSSSYLSSSDSRFDTSSEKDRGASIPGLGDYDYPPDKPAAPPEPSRHIYTSESATNILLHFGLEKDDLEDLIAYPEDQVTPANLPLILRQIRIQKAERTATAASTAYSETSSSRSGMDSLSSSKPKGYPEPPPLPPSRSRMDSLNSSRPKGYLEPPPLPPSRSGMDSLSSSRPKTYPEPPPLAPLRSTVDSVSGSKSKLYPEHLSCRSGMDSLSSCGTAEMRTKEISSSILQPSKVIDYGHVGKYTGVVADEMGRTSGGRASGGSEGILKMDTNNGSSREPLQSNAPALKSSGLVPSRDKGSSFSGLSSMYSSILSSGTPPSHDRTKGLNNEPNQSSILSSFNLPKTDTDIRVHNPETSKPIPVKEPNMDHKHHSVRPSRPGFVVYDSRAKDQSKTQGSTVAEVAQKQEMQQQVWKQAVPQQKTQPMTSPVTMQKPVGQTLGLPSSSATKPTVSSVPLTSHIPSITNTLRRPVVFPGASHPVVIQPTLPQSTVPFVPSTPSVLPTNKQPLANVTTSKGLPTHALMHDYAAASPRVFPHTCCLCSRQCGHMKDWITHQNTSLHLENCKKLRQQYPEWDGEIKLPSSAAKPSSSSQPQHRPLKTRHESRSRSRSRSSSPRRFYDSDSRREKYRSRSRSRSPPSSRHSRRSWSRSPPTSSRHYRSRSRERRFSPKRSHERRSPRRIDERRLSPRRIREGRPSPLRSHDRKSSPPSEERRLVSRSSHEKQSLSEKSSTQRKSSSSSAEKLAKKLLESTAVQSLSNQSDLETVVKTLAPALLAELAKINSSAASSSSSSSSKGGKRSPPRSAGGKKSSFSASSSLTTAKKKEPIKGKPSAQKTETTSSAKKASLPTQVWIGGLTDRVSHEDVASAVEQFGKTKSLLLFRLKQQAMVMFEKEEDAKKLKSAKMFQIKGHSVTIIREKGSVSKEEKKLPFTESKQQKKPLQKSVSASKPSTTTATSSTPKKAVTTSAPAGKVSVKGQGTVTGAKVVVSKVKKASAKVTVKSEICVKTAVKKPAIKPQLNEGGNIINISNDESEAVAQKRPVKTPEDKSTAPGAAAKQKVKETAAKGSTDACSGIKTSKHEGSKSPKHTAEAPEIGTKTVPKPEVKAEPDKTIVETKDPEPMDVEKMGDESMKVESHTEATEEKAAIPEAVPVDSTEKTIESQVPSSSPGTPPTPTTTAHTTKLPAEDNTQWSQTATAVPENIVEVLPQVPQSPVAPESTVLQPEDKTEASQIQPQAAEVLSEATVETNLQEDSTVSEKTETNAPLSEVASKTEIMDMDASTAEVTSTVEQTETNASTAEVTSTVEKMETNASTAEVTSTVEKMETDASTAEVTSTPEAKAAAMDKVEPSTSTAPAAAETSLTIGELLHEHLRQARFVCLKMKNIFTPKFLSNTDRRQLLISGLPPYSDGCYTEDDITKLLKPFGFQYEDDTIYVIPQTQLAVVMMPTVQCVVKAMRGLAKNGCTLNGNLIKMHVIENTMGMTPIGFYKSLMKRIKLRVSGDRERIVYIKNISPSQINDLREKLQKIDFVKHFLPLLNKVFVEFKSGRDADRLGVWHSLLNKMPPYEIYRLKQPHSFTSALPPRLTAKAIPDSVDAAPGVIIPGANFGIPQGSMCPFWVPMTTRSFLFPTESPWFIIPDFLTVRKSEDIYRVKRSLLPTIMLTGLPEANYSHVDIAKLVWPYFSKQTLQSLYYNIIVLTLQRRAFVYFSNWNKCLAFVREHIKNPIFMKGVPLYVHCVLQNMSAVYSEENMYKSLMKLSNSRAPDPESLEERLLCVELAETSDSIIEAAVGVVASIAPFLSFLPLANRICIEMKDASGVAKVMEKHSAHTPSLEECTVWDKVKRFEPVKSLKQRLQDSGDTIINLDTISQLINIETVTDEATSAAEEPQTLPDPPPTPSDNRTQTDTSVSAEPAETVITEPSDPTNEAALMEDTEQSEPVTSMDVSITPVNEEHVREEVSEEEAVSADDVPLTSEVLCENESASSPDSLALVVKPEENADKFPQINEEVFKVLTAAVRQHRLTKGSSSHTGETPPLVPPSNESQPTWQSSSPASAASSPTAVKPEENVSDLSVNNEGSLQVLAAAVGQHMIIKGSSSDSTEKEDQVSEEPDLSGDYVSSDYFNMEDFVTVDEVCDDGGDTIPQCHHSPERTSKKSSETKREGNKESQGSSSSSDTKWSSARSSKDSKRSASSSSSSSSRSTKEHFKSPSSSSSTSGSPKKNKEPSASSKSPSKTSSSKASASASVPSTSSDSATLSSRSHSASSAHKKEKMTTATSVEAHSVNAKAESVVAKSDHQVSAESTAAKTVESEVKTNAPSEMHPPLQEQRVQGTSQAQKGSSRVHLNEETVKDLRRNKLGNDEDALKYTEKGDDEVESYQILDSVDEQTDEQMDDEAQGGLHEGQTLNEETFQILDSVDDEGKAEECSEMEMDASFQVLDSLTEEKESTDKQPSEKESIPGNEKSTNQDAVGGDQKMNPDDADIKHGERSTREGSRRKRKQDTVSESHKSTKEVENPQEEVMKVTVTEPVSDITDQETFEILDSIDDQTATVSEVTDVNPVTRSKRYGSRRKRKEEALPEESQKISKEVENTDGQTRKEDGKDAFKQLYSESTEEETFEILDSIEEQTATQNDVQKPETCSDQKEHVKPKEGGEEEAYQVIDSVEDQPTIIETELETERKEKQMKKTETTRTTRRSVTSTRASRSEETEKSSSKKHERTVKRYEMPAKKETSAGVSRKDKEIQEVAEETVYEIVDSVEDEPAQDRSVRRRSTRGRKEEITEASKKADRDEDATYDILDSVEDKSASDEPSITTRSKGRPRATKRDTLSNRAKTSQKEDMPTKKMRTPARESQERKMENASKKDNKDGTPTNSDKEVIDEEMTYQILDSLEDEGVEHDPPVTEVKAKRGRPKKQVKTTKKGSKTLKNEQVAEEEEATYQILDSLEEETVDNMSSTNQTEARQIETLHHDEDELVKSVTPVTGSLKKEEEEEEEEEPVYEIVDSLEDDQGQDETAIVEEKKQTKDESPSKDGAVPARGDFPTCSSTEPETVDVQEKSQTADVLEQVKDGTGVGEESGTKESSPKIDKEDIESQSDVLTLEYKTEQKNDNTAAMSTLTNRDEVREEDDHDNTSKEGELRTTQVTAKDTRLSKDPVERRTKEREDRRTRDNEEEKRRSTRRRGTRRTKGRGRDEEETVEVDAKELVTVDEVGADEAGTEAEQESQEWEGEMQTLVTLDEIVEEEEEEAQAEQSTLKTHLPIQDEESTDSLNPETLVTLDEAGDDEEEEETKAEEEKSFTIIKDKHEETEESVNFVTVDEVGEVEDQKEEATPRRRGRGRKRCRQAPVRKSIRGKRVCEKDAREEGKGGADTDAPPPASSHPAPSSDKAVSTSVQTDVLNADSEGRSQDSVHADSGGREQKQTLDRGVEEGTEGTEETERWSRAHIKVDSKRRREPLGPEVKRSRSQSPCVSSDFKLPPFTPNTPLGPEFVVPKSGFFCNLCCLFYLNESTAREQHCSSQRHYHNLQKHYQKLQQKQLRSSAASTEGAAVSDLD